MDHRSDTNLNCSKVGLCPGYSHSQGVTLQGSSLKKGRAYQISYLGEMLGFDSCLPCPIRLPKTWFYFTGISSRQANAFREKEALSGHLAFQILALPQITALSYYFVGSLIHLRNIKRIFLSTFLVLLNGPNYQG